MENQQLEQNPLAQTTKPSNELHHKVHKLSRYFLLFAALIGIASSIFFFYFYFTYQPPQTPQTISQDNLNSPSLSETWQNTAADPMANWMTYTNKNMGYSIQYPENVFIRTICSNKELILENREPNELRETIEVPACGRGGRFAIEVVTYNLKKGVKPYSDYSDYSISEKDIKIAGIETKLKTFSFVDKEDPSLLDWFSSASITKGDFIYEITLGDKSFVEEFNQILSTFKFLGNEIDYYSCKDLEKLPFQYVENVQFSIGYIDVSGTVELRSDGKWYIGSDQEVKGVYLRFPMQKTGEKSLFYSQFIEEARGNSANANIEGEDLLFRLGEYDDKNIFSSEASIPQNFQSEIEKALQDKTPINLHLVISVPPSRDAPSNTSGACKIDIF